MVNLVQKEEVIDELCTNKGYAELIRFLDDYKDGKSVQDLIAFVNQGKTNQCSKVAKQALQCVSAASVDVRGILVSISRNLNKRVGTVEVDE